MDQKIFLSINSKPFDFNIETLSIDQSLLENMQSCSSKWKLEIDEIDTSQEKVLEYFNTLFSPKLFAESLIRHNQHLELKCLENSDSEPEELYVRRAKRVKNLQQK